MRALAWITHRSAEQPALVVIEGVGAYGAGLAQRVADAGLLVAEPSAMPAAQRRGVGKTDALDAVRIARSVLAVDVSRLRWPRAIGPCPRVVLRVLMVKSRDVVHHVPGLDQDWPGPAARHDRGTLEESVPGLAGAAATTVA